MSEVERLRAALLDLLGLHPHSGACCLFGARHAVPMGESWPEIYVTEATICNQGLALGAQRVIVSVVGGEEVPGRRDRQMIITAKFASSCPCCSARILVGSKVEWTKGEKARHVACAGSSVPARTARPSAATIAYARAWRTPGRSLAQSERDSMAEDMGDYSHCG